MSAPPAQILLDLLREGLTRGDRVALTVSSNSMRPLLHAGDSAYLKAAKVADLASGDIITVIDPTETAVLLTHRFYGLIAGDTPLLITRGDRVISFDALCPAENLVGRVVGRQGGGKTLWLMSGAGATLNGRLARLAIDEVRRVAGVPLPSAFTRASIDHIAAQLSANARQPVMRLYRRWIGLQAAGLTHLVDDRPGSDGDEWKPTHV